jgi:hypothetical protein
VVMPPPNSTEHLEPGGVNVRRERPVRGGIVVKPPTQALVELLGLLDVGDADGVDLDLHVESRAACVGLLWFHVGAGLAHVNSSSPIVLTS